MVDEHNIARAAAAILRTERPLSKEFREQVAQMVEAMDACHTDLWISETSHSRAGRPFYSRGLEMAKAALNPRPQHTHHRGVDGDGA